MTSPFQTELSDRAAAHARDWEAAHDPSVGLAEVEASVRRRRRGRGLLAVGAGAACVALVASVAYAALGRGPDVAPVGPGPVNTAVDDAARGPGDIDVLIKARPGWIVIGVDARGEGLVESPGPEQYALFNAEGQPTGDSFTVQELGRAVGLDAAYIVTPLAYDSSSTVLMVMAGMPSAYAAQRYLLLNVKTGVSADVESPCGESSSSGGDALLGPAEGAMHLGPVSVAQRGFVVGVDCGEGGMAWGVVDPATAHVTLLRPQDSVTASLALRDLSASSPTSDLEASQPFVLDGQIFVNMATSSLEALPLLAERGGAQVEVGGGPVHGIAVVGGRLLIATDPSPHEDTSSWGRTVGVWDPQTGEYEPTLHLMDPLRFSTSFPVG